MLRTCSDIAASLRAACDAPNSARFEAHPRVSERELVTVVERLLLHTNSIDPRAVRGIEVDEDVTGAPGADLRMVATDVGIREDDVRLRHPPHADDPFA